MFAPLKTWRRWHRKVNTTQKRHASATAIAASALPALVYARGHAIDEVPELPLVVDDSVQALQKTKQAIKLLNGLGLEAELEKVLASKKLRAGKGKLRNRRFTLKRGPLVIYAADDGLTKAFRNIPGVDLAHVERLNLLQLAPGGTFGRLIVWTEGAFRKLNAIFGTHNGPSQQKKGYMLPRPVMVNADVGRLINSDEVQSVVRPALEGGVKYSQKKNPLKNVGIMRRLFPGIHAVRKANLKKQTKGTRQYEQVQKKKADRIKAVKTYKRKANSKAFYRKMMDAYKPKEPPAETEGEADEE